MRLFYLVCLRHLIGLKCAEWPVAGQRKYRQAWGDIERVNRRRNLGSVREKERETRMRTKRGHTTGQKSGSHQLDTSSSESKIYKRKEK